MTLRDINTQPLAAASLDDRDRLTSCDILPLLDHHANNVTSRWGVDSDSTCRHATPQCLIGCIGGLIARLCLIILLLTYNLVSHQTLRSFHLILGRLILNARQLGSIAILHNLARDDSQRLTSLQIRAGGYATVRHTNDSTLRGNNGDRANSL